MPGLADNSANTKMPSPHKNPTSLNSIAERLHCDKRTLAGWIRDDGIDPSDLKAVEKCVKAHKKQISKRGDEDSPFKRKAEAEAERLERRNRIEEKLEARDYVTREDVTKLLQLGIGKIEQVPEKMASEFALPVEQVKRLTVLLDEAREGWVRELK